MAGFKRTIKEHTFEKRGKIMWMEERNGRYRFVEQYIDPYTEKRKRVSVTLNSKSNQA